MSAGGGPTHGVKLEYENVVVAITGGIIAITITTKKTVVMKQISQDTGEDLGGSTVPIVPS